MTHHGKHTTMKRKTNIFLTCTVLTLTTALFAQNKVSFHTNFFSDNSGTTVNSPTVDFVKALAGNVNLLLRYNLDRVIIPPVRGLSAAPTPTDGVTGASRPVSGDDPANQSFSKDRNEFIVGVNLQSFSASYYYSNEVDYIGRQASVSTNFDFNKKNSNLAMAYSYGWDRINPLGTDTLHTQKVHSLNVSLTQVINPKLIGRAGIDLSHVDGFQSNPYRTVNGGGQIFLENHPLSRSRGAFFIKLSRYFVTETAFSGEYRFYRDNWNVQSHTFNFFYHQYFNENVLIRYRYRYYVQTATDFYRSAYPIRQKFMTSDYKLEAFNAHLFGLKIEYKLKDLVKDGFMDFLQNSTFEAKYERYFTSRDFTADIFQFGLVLNY